MAQSNVNSAFLDYMTAGVDVRSNKTVQVAPSALPSALPPPAPEHQPSPFGPLAAFVGISAASKRRHLLFAFKLLCCVDMQYRVFYQWFIGSQSQWLIAVCSVQVFPAGIRYNSCSRRGWSRRRHHSSQQMCGLEPSHSCIQYCKYWQTEYRVAICCKVYSTLTFTQGV